MDKSADRPRLAALAAAWVGLFLLVDPRGDFPLNDDFQYAEAARRLVAGEGMHLPQWALSSTVFHAAAGAVATAPWGASNQALRVWELLLGGAGLFLVYALARRWRASSDAALLAALAVAWCPLYACLSASFHLDVTVSVLTLAGLLAFLKGRERRSPAWYALASALAAASGLTRQTGYLSVAGGLAALAWERRLSRREAAALVFPAALSALAFAWWFRAVHGPTWAWESGLYSPRTDLAYWLRPAVWGAVAARAGKAVLMTALFLSPLAVLRARGSLRRPSRGEALALAAVAAAGLRLWAQASGLPLLFNTLNHVGLGTGSLLDADDKPGGWWESPWLWWAAGERARPAWGLAAALVMGAWSAAGLRDYFAWNRARWAAGVSAVAHGVPPASVENGFDWDGQFTLTANLDALRRRKPAREIGIWEWQTLNRVVLGTAFGAAYKTPGWTVVEEFPYRTPLLPGRGGVVRLFAAPGAVVAAPVRR
ncbi:MAG: glycosyltransferase family 39 protein [Elusimicrobia bacterium]|nr:glycosyltransferase family 39 protein [Elusimicrobiota bacterium]